MTTESEELTCDSLDEVDEDAPLGNWCDGCGERFDGYGGCGGNDVTFAERIEYEDFCEDCI